MPPDDEIRGILDPLEDVHQQSLAPQRWGAWVNTALIASGLAHRPHMGRDHDEVHIEAAEVGDPPIDGLGLIPEQERPGPTCHDNGRRLRQGDPNDAHPDAAPFDQSPGLDPGRRSPCEGIQDIGGEPREVTFGHAGLKGVESPVELMIAERGGVVALTVVQVHGGCTPTQIGNGSALKDITRGEQHGGPVKSDPGRVEPSGQHGGSTDRYALYDCGEESTMEVIGMENLNGTKILLVCASRPLGVRASGAATRQGREQERQQRDPQQRDPQQRDPMGARRCRRRARGSFHGRTGDERRGVGLRPFLRYPSGPRDGRLKA